MRSLAVLLLLMASLLPPIETSAQTGSLMLAPAKDSLSRLFASITSFRELSTDQVLISDHIDNVLVVADFRSGADKMIGRVGSGPGEYRLAGPLFALAADSTLFVDGLNGRWLLLAGATFVAVVPPSDPALQAAGLSIHGTDGRGRILSQQPLPGELLPKGRRRTSARLVRVDRRTWKVDSLAKLRGAEWMIQSAGTAASGQVRGSSVIFSVAEQGVLFADGWVAVARQSPYRVDWIMPSGRHILGAPIPWTAPRVTDSEKKAWRDRSEQRSGRSVDPSAFSWADEVPPFAANGLLATPGGQLLLLRPQWSGSRGTEYDIIDRTGARSGTLRLRDTERIVGFGAGWVYVAATDDDGMQRLRRHPWA